MLTTGGATLASEPNVDAAAPVGVKPMPAAADVASAFLCIKLSAWALVSQFTLPCTEVRVTPASAAYVKYTDALLAFNPEAALVMLPVLYGL